jgi:hypothetical protein
MSDHDTPADDAREAAEFAGGFEGKTPPPVKEKPAPAAETPRATEPTAPEYVQITKAELAEMKAAAAKTASYDAQLAKAFGTIGGLQRHVNELRTQTPRDLEVRLPDQAFTKMAKDFPELAELSREEFQAALAGLKAAGNAKPDPEAIKNTLVALEIEDLEDAYPEWRKIVGAINAETEKPDPENPFRKWLATKDKAYQDRINGTIRAPVIQRAIRLFQNETKASAKPATPPTPRDTARAERIRAAVQPRGDGAGTSSGKSENDEFESGYAKARS